MCHGPSLSRPREPGITPAHIRARIQEGELRGRCASKSALSAPFVRRLNVIQEALELAFKRRQPETRQIHIRSVLGRIFDAVFAGSCRSGAPSYDLYAGGMKRMQIVTNNSSEDIRPRRV